MPSKKKKYNARFPAGRIKKIMQTDEEVGKVAQAVPVIISRTLELFVESLLTKSLEVTLTRNAKTLSPSHVKLCISAESRFDFLKDLVKNIPDISQAEEKELCQSAESSPNAYRFPDVPPGPSAPGPVRNPHIQHLHGRNGRTGDLGTEYELPGKRSIPNRLPKSYNNGRNAPRHTAVVPEAVIDLVDENRVTGLETRSAISNIPSVAVSVQNTSLRESRPSRLPNFYTETLNTGEDDDSVRVNHPSYGSVIRPNPDYSPQSEPLAYHKRMDSYDKNTISNMINSSEEQPAALRLDLSKSFLRNASVDSGTDSVFRLDLSAMPSENRETNDSLYNPSSAWQPRTPDVQFKFFPESLKRSDSCPKRGPPPLLKRSASEGVKVSNSIEMPPLANIGPSSVIHLDLSRSNIEKAEIPSPPSCSVTKKKKGNFSNEPPPLLPITSTQKTAPVVLQKNKSVEMQLDEDYDT